MPTPPPPGLNSGPGGSNWPYANWVNQYGYRGSPNDAAAWAGSQGGSGGAQSAQTGGSGYNPFQPYYYPQTPTADPMMYQPNSDPSAIIQQIMTAFAPQSAQAQQNMNATLAASGLSGGPAIQAQDVLQRNLAAGLAPELGQAIEFGLGQQQQAGMFDVGQQNQFTLQNLMNQIGTQRGNTELANDANSQMRQMLMQDWMSKVGAYSGLASQGMSGGAGLAQSYGNAYPVYGSPNFGGLFNMMAPPTSYPGGGGGASFGASPYAMEQGWNLNQQGLYGGGF